MGIHVDPVITLLRNIGAVELAVVLEWQCTVTVIRDEIER